MSDYKTFLVPYDFSAHASAALDLAVDLGRRLDADIHLVHVVHSPVYAHGYGMHGVDVPPMHLVEVREGAAKSLDEVAAATKGAPGKIEVHIVEGFGIADAIRDTAEQIGADVIVMGTHGRTGLAHVFLGSVTERTLRRAPCPVLTIQAENEE